MSEEFTVTHWTPSDLLETGPVECVGFRPQKINAEEPYCRRCGRTSRPMHVMGRWDFERNATALPFDPVWVRMTCGCEFGDMAFAEP